MGKNDAAEVVFAAPWRAVRRLVRHPLAGAAVRLTGFQYASAGLSLLTTLLAARWLGPSAYGVAALVTAYPALVFSVVAVKPVPIVTRYLAVFRAEGRAEDLRAISKWGYVTDLGISLVALALVTATGWWVARAVYQLPQITWLMIVYAASFPLFSLSGTSWAVLSAWHRFDHLAVLQVTQPAVTLVVLLVMLAAGAGVSALVVALGLGQAFYGLATALVAARLLRREGLAPWWRASLARVRPLRRDLLAQFGWNHLLVTLSGALMQVPLMMLGRLRGPEMAGYYRLAARVVFVGSYMEMSMGRVVYPTLAERWGAGEREGLRPSLMRWTLAGGLPAAAALVLAIALLPLVLPLLFGHAYAPVTPGAQVMLVGTAVAVVFFWVKHLYYAAGRLNLWSAASGLHTAAVLAAAWPVIQRWGFVGLAGVLAAGKIIFIVTMVSVFRRTTDDTAG